jgi:hypothetical protein
MRIALLEVSENCRVCGGEVFVIESQRQYRGNFAHSTITSLISLPHMDKPHKQTHAKGLLPCHFPLCCCCLCHGTNYLIEFKSNFVQKGNFLPRTAAAGGTLERSQL